MRPVAEARQKGGVRLRQASRLQSGLSPAQFRCLSRGSEHAPTLSPGCGETGPPDVSDFKVLFHIGRST